MKNLPSGWPPIPLSTTGVPTTPVPLVLAFHGFSGTSAEMEDWFGLSAMADEAGFIVVYPQGIGDPPQWDLPGSSDTTFVDALLTAASVQLCIDPLRVFATGWSIGGGMTNVVACRLADRIAAVAPVDGLYGPAWGDPCTPSRPVPVIAFHGQADNFVPYAGGQAMDQPVIGVEEWAAAWAERDRCSSGPVQQASIGDVEPLFWVGCAAPVELYRITHGGHTWPGQGEDGAFGHVTKDISANDLMWDFFVANPLPAA